MDATVLEENSHGTPTLLGHQLEDLLRVETVLEAPVPVATLIMLMLVAEVAAAGAPHKGLEGEPLAERPRRQPRHWRLTRRL
jgi:hypothetical protein